MIGKTTVAAIYMVIIYRLASQNFLWVVVVPTVCHSWGYDHCFRSKNWFQKISLGQISGEWANWWEFCLKIVQKNKKNIFFKKSCEILKWWCFGVKVPQASAYLHLSWKQAYWTKVEVIWAWIGAWSLQEAPNKPICELQPRASTKSIIYFYVLCFNTKTSPIEYFKLTFF